MRIFSNNTEFFLQDFHAKYLVNTFTPAEYLSNTLWPDKALTPLYLKTIQKYDHLKVNVYFKNATLEDVSLLSQKLRYCEIILDTEFAQGKTFQCILKSSDLVKASSHIYTVAFNFDCLVFGAEHEETVTTGTAIFIHGAKDTEAIVSFENTGTTVIPKATLNEYEVYLLQPSESIIIDGVKKLVTSNGENAFDRVGMFSFPKFKVGINEIKVLGNAQIKIMYRERW